ncbi:MAG TPA: hypothetical protein VFL82_03010 [Thermomicrobiales bacterium]|nr:hypothetical protein [Thermomicrobiales bacterium]
MERIASSATTHRPQRPSRPISQDPDILAQRVTDPPTDVRSAPMTPSSLRRGNNAGHHDLILRMQHIHGNRATSRLLGLGAHPGQPSDLQRDPRKPPKDISDIGQKGRDRRKEAAADARAEGRSQARQGARLRLPEYPTYAFSVKDQELAIDEHHRIFVGKVDDRPQLMIASYPIPVATFILELRTRFDTLVTEGNKGIKKPRGLAQAGLAFTADETTANGQLLAANGVFGNALSSDDQKLAAEQALTLALDPLIKKVIGLAKRLGQHFSVPGNAPDTIVTAMNNPALNSPDPGYYLTQLSGAALRYNVEGMVAHYQNLPDYEGSGFDRDHQPHNDLIETVANVPEFAGKRIQAVAAGRTQQGWAIMLQHTRHAAGRTFGTKGGDVTAQFHLDLANKRVALGAGATPIAIRQFCIDYLVQSMKDDVAAMKAVAANDSSYTDMAGMKAGDKTTYKAKVMDQIEKGENQILATEASIRTYDQ